MNGPTGQTSAQPQPAGATTRPPAKPVPGIIRHEGPGTRWGQRHVKGVLLIRLLVAIWLVVLGAIFCVSGQWWGACFFVMAGLVGWLAYQLPRSRARE